MAEDAPSEAAWERRSCTAPVHGWLEHCERAGSQGFANTRWISQCCRRRAAPPSYQCNRELRLVLTSATTWRAGRPEVAVAGLARTAN
jgi:hypothetical protein